MNETVVGKPVCSSPHHPEAARQAQELWERMAAFSDWLWDTYWREFLVNHESDDLSDQNNEEEWPPEILQDTKSIAA